MHFSHKICHLLAPAILSSRARVKVHVSEDGQRINALEQFTTSFGVTATVVPVAT